MSNATTTIRRQRILAQTDGSPIPGVPIISQVVTHGDTVQLCGVIAADPRGPMVDDVGIQTTQVLHRIDELLAGAGTDKSRLLSAQVWLADMDQFADHNDAWNAWVDPANPPVRACIQARLTHPGLLVEIMVTAAR